MTPGRIEVIRVDAVRYDVHAIGTGTSDPSKDVRLCLGDDDAGVELPDVTALGLGECAGLARVHHLHRIPVAFRVLLPLVGVDVTEVGDAGLARREGRGQRVLA